MATSFPQLLRRSKFASHDPQITRVYKSTPSAVYQHGDWGMKYPIHRVKGPKHISVNALDTGTILGSDWRSAEKEARFVENWGRAGRWTNGDMERERHDRLVAAGLPGSGRRSYADKYAERDLEAENQAAEQRRILEEGRVRVPDVNGMTRREFARYIATVRRERGEFLATKLEGMRETTRGAKEVEHESKPTLVGLAARGLASTRDPAHFQSNLTHREMGSTTSDRIHSTPHPMFGLTYSSLSPSGPSIRGRVLHKKSAPQNRNPRFNPAPLDNNHSHVASIGGVTAELDTSNQSVRDPITLTSTDFSRSDRTAGEHSFTINQAKLTSPPTVQYLSQSQRAAQWDTRGHGRPIRQSGAAQPSPLDTAAFDIKLRLTDDKATSVEPGSKEWVGQEPRRTAYATHGDLFGSVQSGLRVGSEKASRTRGEMTAWLGGFQAEAERKANDKKAREANNNHTRDLIRRLGRLRRDSADDGSKE